MPPVQSPISFHSPPRALFDRKCNCYLGGCVGESGRGMKKGPYGPFFIIMDFDCYIESAAAPRTAPKTTTSKTRPIREMANPAMAKPLGFRKMRSEEHTSELQSRPHLVCRLLLEKKKTNK